MEYDVIIVGGGVAGCYLASLLGDANVLVLEKNKKIRPKDSGIVSSRIFSFFKRPPIKASISRMELVSPSGITAMIQDEKPYAHILRRRRFTRFLRQLAKRKADVRYEEARFIKYEEDGVRVETESNVYHAKVIIGADGAGSIVRKRANIRPPKIVLGMMVKTRQRMAGDIQVFLNKYFSPEYFAWIIPQSNEYGIMTGLRPKSYLDYFAKQMFLPGGKIYAYLVPLGYTKSYADRTLLLGDACGQNKPLTGGGIIFSLKCARIAAEHLKFALMEDRFGASQLSDYETHWKRAIGLEIDRQFFARRIYRNLTNKEIDDIIKSLGPSISELRGFDYDRLSATWKMLPKGKLLKLGLTKFHKAF